MFIPNVGNKARISTLIISVENVIEVLTDKGKKLKGLYSIKKKIKMISFADNMTICLCRKGFNKKPARID